MCEQYRGEQYNENSTTTACLDCIAVGFSDGGWCIRDFFGPMSSDDSPFNG